MNNSTLYRHYFLTLILSVNIFFCFSQNNIRRSDTIPVIEYNFHPHQLILPASLITAGALGTAINGMNDFHLFNRKEHDRRIRIDDYLEWGMLGWVFVCDLMGKEKHPFTDQIFLLLLAEGMNATMVHSLKNWINEPRPDGGPRSFPSGHTSNVFLGAHMAYKEFKDSNPWLAYSGYGIGVFVGISRLYNNRHWLADVIAGAGFGILSVELAYLIYFPLRNAIVKKINDRPRNKLMVAPAFTHQGGGFSFIYTF